MKLENRNFLLFSTFSHKTSLLKHLFFIVNNNINTTTGNGLAKLIDLTSGCVVEFSDRVPVEATVDDVTLHALYCMC